MSRWGGRGDNGDPGAGQAPPAPSGVGEGGKKRSFFGVGVLQPQGEVALMMGLPLGGLWEGRERREEGAHVQVGRGNG